MANDWIKVDHDLADKPEVIEMAHALELDPDTVVGKLIRVWTWFDKHTTDGHASVTVKALLASRLRHDGFLQAMKNVGWLTEKHSKISIPNFDRYLGNSARARALSSVRSSRYRHAQSVTSGVESPLTLTHRHSDTWTLPLDFDWEATRGDCNRLLGTVKPRSQQDRDLLVKAVVLSRTVFDAEWLWTAATAAKRKKPHEQFRYLHGALRGKSKDRGENFNLLLKRIEIPEIFRQSTNGVMVT